MPLSFQPACLPIIQGGLPHQHAPPALALLLNTTPVILTWPALAQRDFREHTYIQSAIGYPGLVLDPVGKRAYVQHDQAEAELDRLGLAYLQRNVALSALAPEDAAALAELLRMETLPPHNEALVSQLLGPVSLSLQLTDEHQQAVVHTPMLLDALMQHLTLRVTWLTTRLNDLTSGDVVICLDEPLIGALGSPFCPLDWDDGIGLIEQVFAGTRGCRGLIVGNLGERQRHLPYSEGLRMLLQTSVELLLFDMYNDDELLPAIADILPALFERSGTLAWGLVPADYEALGHTTATDLLRRFETLLAHLSAAGLDQEQVVQSSLIATNGGLAHLPVSAAEAALRLCVELSNLLRDRYGLTGNDRPQP
jgi:hypothetical protein